MTPAEVVGRAIRQNRLARGLSQAELGEAVAQVVGGKPWTKQAISAAEQGKRDFSAAEIYAFAKALKCPVYDLLLMPREEPIEFPQGVTLTYEEALQLITGMPQVHGRYWPRDEAVIRHVSDALRQEVRQDLDMIETRLKQLVLLTMQDREESKETEPE